MVAHLGFSAPHPSRQHQMYIVLTCKYRIFNVNFVEQSSHLPSQDRYYIPVRNPVMKTEEEDEESLVITLSKKGNLQLCQNYRTINLISHPINVMLKIILNRLQPKTEETITEEQAGFRAGRSTTEQIFNLKILCENYMPHQQNLYHVFIDFKKAIDKVWHEALWATMRQYNINASIIRAMENL